MNTHNKPNIVSIMLIFSICCSALAAALRIIFTFTSLEVSYGVYRHGHIAPTVFHIILAAVCVISVLLAVLKAPKLSADHSLRTDNFTVFTAVASSFLLGARVLVILWSAVNGYNLGTFELLEICFAVVSIIYFLGLSFKSQKQSAALAAASFFPIGWCAVCLISLYFDTEILMTSPNKILGLVSLLAAMIYFLCEARFQTANVSHCFYLAAATVSPILLLTSAIPNVVCFNILSIGTSEDLIRYAIEAAIGLFIYARFFSYAGSVKVANGNIPESNI